jgi:hypothetical protein
MVVVSWCLGFIPHFRDYSGIATLTIMPPTLFEAIVKSIT